MADPVIERRLAGSALREQPPTGGAGGAPRLPWSPLLAMALTGFIIIMTETLPAGLLPQVAGGLSVSESAAGQLVSAYALGTVLAALPAVALTRGAPRKRVLLIGIAGFVVANAATALAGDYATALVARFVAGAFSGLLWSMLAGYARKVVPPSLAGRALAVAMVGTPVALAVGTPLGALAGSVVSWRWVFAAMSLLAVAALVWVVAGVPDRPGQPPETSTPLLRVALLPGIRPVLAVVLAWMLAHNVLYTYIAPYLASTGVGARTDVVLLVFGVAALAGIWVTGVLVDRALRLLVIGSLAGFGAVAVVLALASGVPVVLYGAVAVWGLSFGGAATQLQTASADAAGDDADVAQAMITTTWNLAIFGGAAVGGLVLDAAGPTSFPWLLVVLVALALTVTTTRRRAFPPGRRPTP